MKDMIAALLGVLTLIGGAYASGVGIEKVYGVVKREALEKIARGQPSLELFTRKLTRKK